MMKKAELISAMVQKAPNLTKKTAEESLAVLTEVITESLAKGESVPIPNLGTFKTSVRKEREGRNPHDGSKIVIPEATLPKFSASSVLKKAVDKK